MMVGAEYQLEISASWGNRRSLLFALLAGAVFAHRAGWISTALIRYDASNSQLPPQYNMNVIVAVLGRLFMLGELMDVHGWRFLGGELFITPVLCRFPVHEPQIAIRESAGSFYLGAGFL